MYVQESWKGGYKYFIIDLGDGEARTCLSPCKRMKVNLEAYGVEGFPNGKIYYVDFLKVSPQYRNKGYGAMLLKAMMQWANDSKNVIILDAVPMDTGMDHNRLIRFYISHGFKLANHKNNRYSMYYHNRKPVRNRNKTKHKQQITAVGNA